MQMKMGWIYLDRSTYSIKNRLETSKVLKRETKVENLVSRLAVGERNGQYLMKMIDLN